MRLTSWKPAWQGFLVARRRLVPAADYWVRTAAEGCWVYLLAGEALPAELESWAAALVGPADAGRLEFHDARRASHRWATLKNGRLESCLFLGSAGPAGPSSWLVERFALGTVSETDRMRLLCERSDTAGRTVCSCQNVSESAILAAIADHGLDSAEAVGQTTRAGTGCGSCRSEIIALIDRRVA